jgi:hypothetical protein
MQEPSQIFYHYVLHTSGEHAGHFVVHKYSMREGNPGSWWIEPFTPICFGRPIPRDELGTTLQEAEAIARREVQTRIEEHRKAILELEQALKYPVLLVEE